jgi:hypothetical protein
MILFVPHSLLRNNARFGAIRGERGRDSSPTATQAIHAKLLRFDQCDGICGRPGRRAFKGRPGGLIS